MTMNLEDVWNDDADRIFRTARHEAGHAVIAWLLAGAGVPPFEYVEIRPQDEKAGGIVPGGVAPYEGWIETRTPVEAAAIYLAGAYFQDGDAPFEEDDWRQVVESKDGGDSVNDVALTMNLANKAGLSFASLIQDARRQIEMLGDKAERWVYTIAVALTKSNMIDATGFGCIVAKEPLEIPSPSSLVSSVPKLALVLKNGSGEVRAVGLGSDVASALDELSEFADASGAASLQSFVELIEDTESHDADALKDAARRVKNWYKIADGQAAANALLNTVGANFSAKVIEDVRALSLHLYEVADNEWLFCFAYSV